MSVDDEFALVGSGNCDQRSFYLDYEVASVFYDGDIARGVRRIQERYILDSDPVDLETWSERSRVHSTLDRIAGLSSPLL